MAYYMCQDFIEKRLAAPATAKWPSSSEINIATLTGTGRESYRVRGYVDSQNSFGALLRTNYVCDVSFMGKDNWHLENLTFDE